MSDHRISANGMTIECHATSEADCRYRPGPECESETWQADQCIQCPETHARLRGQDCWMIEWVNNVGMLDDCYTGPGSPVTIYPGKDVVLDWGAFDEGVGWDYAR